MGGMWGVGLGDFWRDFSETGQVEVGLEDDPATDPDLPAALRRRDARCRGEAPGEAPSVLMPVAVWAAALLYRGCQFLVYREASAAFLEQGLSDACPQGGSAAARAWSADLGFKPLPELWRLARRAAPDDPLVTALERIGRAWPMSSVGIPGLNPLAALDFLADPCLLRLYRDRVLAAGDTQRLDDPRVRDAVRDAIGAYPELHPAMARALKEAP